MPYTRAATETAKLLIAVAVGCLLLWFGQTIISWKQQAEQNKQRGRTMEAASGIAKDGDDSRGARADADAEQQVIRHTFDFTIEEDRRREPETDVRDSAAVPASRLRAFEQRRREREKLAADRLRRAGVQREE